MGRRRYALERGGPKRIRLRWPLLRLRRLEVTCDDGPTWTLDRRTALQGATLVLPDGSSLFVRYVKRPWYSVGLRDELAVERDGIPLPGSDGDPRVVGRRAGTLVFILGLLQLLAVAAVGGDSPSFPWLLGETVLVLLLGVLGFLGVRVAVLIAAALFALGLPLALVFTPVGVVVQVAIVVNLFLAWRKMKPREKAPSLREIFE